MGRPEDMPREVAAESPPLPLAAATGQPHSPTVDSVQQGPSLSTTSLLEMLERYRAGDTAALDELLRRTAERTERMARRMLRNFPLVQKREETGDVVNNALLRLTRALREVRPASTLQFFGLTAEQIRRELLDLARHYRRRAAVDRPFPDGMNPQALVDPHGLAASDLDRWHTLHESIENLSADLRQVFELRFYGGCMQQDIATLLGISKRHVRRLWRLACWRLGEILRDDLPTC